MSKVECGRGLYPRYGWDLEGSGNTAQGNEFVISASNSGTLLANM